MSTESETNPDKKLKKKMPNANIKHHLKMHKHGQQSKRFNHKHNASRNTETHLDSSMKSNCETKPDWFRDSLDETKNISWSDISSKQHISRRDTAQVGQSYE